METNNERRLRKLKLLCDSHGISDVAEKAGLSPVYLRQIINGTKLPAKKGDSSRSERALGEANARAIEIAYNLGRGWFDNDGEQATMSPRELQLLGLFRELEDEKLQGIVLEHVRESLLQRRELIARMKGPTRELESGSRPPPDREHIVAPPATKRRAAR